LQDSGRLNALSHSEKALFHEVTLWIDLRFATEIDSPKISPILQHAPGGPFEMLTFEDPRGLDVALRSTGSHRIYLHSEGIPFSMDSIITYASKNWIAPEAFADAETKEQQKAVVMAVLAQRGLAGILETVRSVTNLSFKYCKRLPCTWNIKEHLLTKSQRYCSIVP
jgi:hypothetical protein